MTCEELLKALNDYIDDESTLAICQDFGEHLAACSPCQLVVDNIRKTIQLYQGGEPYPTPPELEARIRAALSEKWKQRFPHAQF